MKRIGATVSRKVSAFWIIADYQGHTVILKAKGVQSEQEAMEYGYNHLDVPFTVVELPTVSRSTAASILKARTLDETGNLGRSIQRTMAKPPQEYKRKWWTQGEDTSSGGDQL
jgi:hypothetical protein